ncbi:hypothetical protein HKBW3S42_00504 [Candidatus Hakubella thermalkaliphila]|uniref:PIN domain-containing protein n=2 Tax=Candidatus Hakubella thermalkaliphila TaxID=2754717 RepID=A0A6V8PHQ3_9ACTN|nr:PIN domain-containing protein [Candidatus Hakubella thermalkaliphila]GFP18622.1 hypothetical protein HKBW3S03_00127 [Candidatus Hakubella thermalkaliphila]GFP27923.1 hypothetical protein HKBW3S33_01334 [Candidatus Hakubella thermalkaliphila]GFP29889.1 hypothetical protein HKBW3S34_00809 [Candidatus Hakubella thermalkaliphila]GFP32199.1 hypothetical protein HKBW3S42_00504 [Candidatus Hakubella thermalkaliphila]
MTKYLLDTTALIDYLNGRPHVVSLIQSLAREGHTLGLCCINITELYAGLKEHERKRAQRLIERLFYFEVTQEMAQKAGEYQYYFARRGKTLSTSDVTVAAVAVAQEAILLTANVDHYPMDEIGVERLPPRASAD